MSNPAILLDRLDIMAKRQQDNKLALAMTVMSCALMGAMVYRELKPIFRELDRDDKLREPREGRSR